MYEKEITDSASKLALCWRGTPPKKSDRQYTARLVELLEAIEEIGFGGWSIGNPDNKTPGGHTRWDRPKAVLNGVDTTTGEPVFLELYQQDNRVSPKNIAYSLRVTSSDAGVLIGEHIGTLRMTDLRTRVSYYDGVVWREQHFRGQLSCDQMNYGTINPKLIEKQMAAAMVKLGELGITDCKYALLPRAYESLYGSHMRTYLVGMYGAMPCAILLEYSSRHGETNELNMEFYLVNPHGLCLKKFGELMVDKFGKVDGAEMNIGSLLHG